MLIERPPNRSHRPVELRLRRVRRVETPRRHVSTPSQGWPLRHCSRIVDKENAASEHELVARAGGRLCSVRVKEPCMKLRSVGVGLLAALGVLGLAAFGQEPANDKGASKAMTAQSVYEFTVKDIDGKDVALARYKGEVLLIVNVASL